MSNWRAPERVGESIGLEGENLSLFLSTVREIHRQKVQSEAQNYNLDSEYFEFLRQEVFNHPQVIEHLQNSDISAATITNFEDSKFDIESTFESNYKFNYRLDQLVDFILMVKLVSDYLEHTGDEFLGPTDRLHYLAYLTNNELKETSVESIRNQRTDLGMLEFTGYRYTFRKRKNGPYSTRLARDKDRLFAWDLLNEEINDDFDPNEFRPFQLKLGHSGELLTMRYETKFESMRTAKSHLLREWVLAQRNVIERFAEMPIGDLREYVTQINQYRSKSDGRVLLTGRPRFFDPQAEGPLTTIAGGMQSA